MIFDPEEQFGQQYLICLSGEAKYGYLQNEEDACMALVDTDTAYEYKAPTPQGWESLKSDELIERDWVTDSRPKVIFLILFGTDLGQGCIEIEGKTSTHYFAVVPAAEIPDLQSLQAFWQIS